MALLSTCWLIIESIVIQDGFLKWFYMKLFMHPLVLFLCQLLIWLYLFMLWLLPFFQACHNAFSSVLVTFSKLFSCFLRVVFHRREVTCNIQSRQEIKNTLNNLELSRSIHNPVPAFSFSFSNQVDSQLKVRLALQKGKFLEEEEEDVDDFFYEFDQEDVVELLDAKEDEEEEGIDIVDAVNMEKNQEDKNPLTNDDEEEDDDIVNSDVETDLSSLLSSDRDHHPSPLSIESLDSTLQESIVMENQTHEVEDDETDQVYKEYCERMRWYDILGRDRTYGLSVITNQLTASSLSSWGKTAEKRLKHSIKKDLELVYVAQSCLSWEALQHQYITVRDHSNPADSRRGLYDDDICREFQNFEVLLERFLEDERCEGKRVFNFVHRRFEFMNFFQVPRLLGYVSTESFDVEWWISHTTHKSREHPYLQCILIHETLLTLSTLYVDQEEFVLTKTQTIFQEGSYNREGPREGEKKRQDKQVLKVIEKCIEVFYDFVKVDIKKPLIWERLKISFMNSPLMELEDPRDFKLFLDLKDSLQKKEQLLKEMQGNKKKIWFIKISSNLEEDKIEKDEHFMLVRFVMIDLKLVSRVLHMSLVSSSHLKWCQQKLNNIHFNGDKISRTFSPVLFPS